MKIIIVENPRPLTMEHYNDVANAPLSASLNSGYALAVAKNAGWDMAYLDFTSHSGNAETMAAAILAESGDLILFHWVYSWGHEQIVYDIHTLLHRDGSAQLGAFGLFPTLARQQLFHYAPHLDFVISGEFEETLRDLLHTFKVSHTVSPLPGIALREGVFIPRPLIGDLSQLPIPDDVGANCSYSSLNIAASRGCYGQCSFCFIHRYYGCSKRRTRTLASLEQELEQRLARRVIDSLYFIDPSFVGQGNNEQKRAVAISHMAKKYKLSFGFETRVDSINPQLLDTLADNGASSIFLGIESGCDSVLARIGKRITTQQIDRAVRAVQQSGIQLTIGFIMFEPDSTLAELEENFTFLEHLGLLTNHDLTANLLYHNQIVLQGSAAWERFDHEERLLMEAKLPFEARYRFRDERVGLVCSAMGNLAATYFKFMDYSRRSRSAEVDNGCNTEFQPLDNDEALNLLLKKAFCDFCTAARTGQPFYVQDLSEDYRKQLLSVIA
jgi:radical SAM superfamily enzyme YgiQ (UPF0313 family)